MENFYCQGLNSSRSHLSFLDLQEGASEQIFSLPFRRETLLGKHSIYPILCLDFLTNFYEEFLQFSHDSITQLMSVKRSSQCRGTGQGRELFPGGQEELRMFSHSKSKEPHLECPEFWPHHL